MKKTYEQKMVAPAPRPTETVSNVVMTNHRAMSRAYMEAHKERVPRVHDGRNPAIRYIDELIARRARLMAKIDVIDQQLTMIEKALKL